MLEPVGSFHAHTFFDNHSSSQLDPDFITKYIASEQIVGRYSDAFLPEDLEELIGLFHTSPLGLVPKPHSDTFRMIQDMSYPHHAHTASSVNAGVNSDKFPTAWGSFNQTASLILSLPPGCLATTFNISAAYRITPIHPNQQQHLCVFWRDHVYIDRAVMFKLTSSAGVFGAIGDMLIAICKEASFSPALKWVDDSFVIHLPDQDWMEQDFINLTGYFSVPWSTKKTRSLAIIQRYIGFNWDLSTHSVSFPVEKCSKTLQLIKDWLKPNRTFLAREAASLQGKLIHMSCIFPLICPFLCSIASFAASFRSPQAKLHIPPPFAADLSWVRFIAQNLLNKMPLAPSVPVDLSWWGNASTSFSIRIVLGPHWAVWKWAPGFSVGPWRAHNIGWAETVTVELGLHITISLHFLSSSLVGGLTFLVRSDNAGCYDSHDTRTLFSYLLSLKALISRISYLLSLEPLISRISYLLSLEPPISWISYLPPLISRISYLPPLISRLSPAIPTPTPL